MASSPTIEWRAATAPFTPLTSLPLTGSGYNGAVLVGTSSAVTTIRLYNNFVAAAGIADATNCVLAAYDDTIHQGTAITVPSTALYLQVQVVDYNGVTTGADTGFYGLGGLTKHPIPVNAGMLAGGNANYVTVNVQVSIPPTATQGTITQGLWLEYSSII